MRVRLAYDMSAQIDFGTLKKTNKSSLLHKAKLATTAALRFNGLLFEGTAYTSRKDTHDPFIGRKLALQRAMQAARLSLSENDRLRIWLAFFARELEQEREMSRPKETSSTTGVYRYVDGRRQAGPAVKVSSARLRRLGQLLEVLQHDGQRAPQGLGQPPRLPDVGVLSPVQDTPQLRLLHAHRTGDGADGAALQELVDRRGDEKAVAPARGALQVGIAALGSEERQGGLGHAGGDRVKAIHVVQDRR